MILSSLIIDRTLRDSHWVTEKVKLVLNSFKSHSIHLIFSNSNDNYLKNWPFD